MWSNYDFARLACVEASLLGCCPASPVQGMDKTRVHMLEGQKKVASY